MPINLPAPGFRDTANEYQFGGDCRRFDCRGLLNLHITVKSLLDRRLSALSFHDSSVPPLVAADMELQCTVERHSQSTTCTRSSVYDQLNHQKAKQAKAIKIRSIIIVIIKIMF